MTVAIAFLVLCSACATKAKTSSSKSATAESKSATAESPTSTTAGGEASAASSTPPCKYLSASDLGTLLPGTLSSSTQSGTDVELCNWAVGAEMPTEWSTSDVGLSVQVTKATNAPLADDVNSLKQTVGDNSVPGLGDFAGFVTKGTNPSALEFVKGDTTVLITLHKSAPTSADYDAMIAIAHKVAAQV